MKRARRIARMLLLCMLLGVFLPYGGVYADDKPTMFVEDEPWYNESSYPRYEIFNEDYVPLSMFSKIEGITYTLRTSSVLRNLVIGDKSGRYLTFDLNASVMYTAEGEEREVSTYLLYANERYVPAQLICSYFGLVYEKNKAGTAVRIRDDKAKKTLEELLQQYNPDLAEKKSDPVVEPDPTLPEGTPRRVYFIWRESWEDEAAFAQICLLLAQYQAGAVFVFRDVAAHYDTVCTAYAYGCRAALDGSSDTDVAALDAENDALYRLIKRRTRLVAAQKKTFALPEGGGYAVCYPEVLLDDSLLTKKNPIGVVERTLSMNTDVYLSLTCSTQSAELLEQVLQLVRNDESCSVGLITDAAWMSGK